MEFFDSDIVQFMCSDDDEEQLDQLLLAASQKYEERSTALPFMTPHTPPTNYLATPIPISPAPAPGTSMSHSLNHGSDNIRKQRFALPKTKTDIEQARKGAVPTKTVSDTKYCINVFEEWRKYRRDVTHDSIPSVTQMTKEEIAHWLTRFVLEVRKKNGDVYPPNTLHHLVVGVMRHVRWSGQPNIDFLKDPEFANFVLVFIGR